MPKSAPSSHSPSRLGVNPRRSHVKDTERKRVRTACNNCNTRRIRCSGEKPCEQCSNSSRPCEYPNVEKKIFVSQKDYFALCANEKAYEKIIADCIPDPTQRQTLLAQVLQQRKSGGEACSTPVPDALPIKDEDVYSSSPMSTAVMSPRRHLGGSLAAAATEGKLLQDRDGTKRWLGGTSGATFLDHLKRFMYTLKSSLGFGSSDSDTAPELNFIASRGQYQTSDSRLLFVPPADSLHSPPLSENWAYASIRFAKVSEYLQDGLNHWPCGGIHYFGDFSEQAWITSLSEQPSGQNPRAWAFYEAAFALGTVYSLTAANSRRDGHLGEMSYAQSSKLVDLAHHTRSMADVPTLALMAMYMMEMNRRDNAYFLLSEAMTVCSAFGGMNGSSTDERTRRVIWTLFCLTRDASCLMGRPLMYADEAFQLPYPAPDPGLPSPDGLIAHIQLSKIAGYIVSNTYSIAPQAHLEPSSQDPAERVAVPLRMLYRWREELPKSLQIPLELRPESAIQLDDKPDDILPSDRPRCVLHMKWNQLLILTLRPFFFLAVKSSVGGDFLNTPKDMYDHKMIDASFISQCSDAARRNLRLGRHLYERCRRDPDAPGKLVMLDLHCIFNAAVVLLLHQMTIANVVNTDTLGIRAARQIFAIEARTECSTAAGASPAGVVGSGYASDCLGVLNDLAALVARIRPLRFRGSEHVNAGVMDVVGWQPTTTTATTVALLGDGGGYEGEQQLYDGGVCSLTDEQLAANLNLTNPYGTVYGVGEPMLMSTTAQPHHTNAKEFERWMMQAEWGLGTQLGGFTGM